MYQPLADLLRPTTLDHVYGQDHILAPEESSDFCHRIVHFGRDCCTARNPHCGSCPVSMFCKEYNP